MIFNMNDNNNTHGNGDYDGVDQMYILLLPPNADIDEVTFITTHELNHNDDPSSESCDSIFDDNNTKKENADVDGILPRGIASLCEKTINRLQWKYPHAFIPVMTSVKQQLSALRSIVKCTSEAMSGIIAERIANQMWVSTSTSDHFKATCRQKLGVKDDGEVTAVLAHCFWDLAVRQMAMYRPPVYALPPNPTPDQTTLQYDHKRIRSSDLNNNQSRNQTQNHINQENELKHTCITVGDHNCKSIFIQGREGTEIAHGLYSHYNNQPTSKGMDAIVPPTTPSPTYHACAHTPRKPSLHPVFLNTVSLLTASPILNKCSRSSSTGVELRQCTFNNTTMIQSATVSTTIRDMEQTGGNEIKEINDASKEEEKKGEKEERALRWEERGNEEIKYQHKEHAWIGGCQYYTKVEENDKEREELWCDNSEYSQDSTLEGGEIWSDMGWEEDSKEQDKITDWFHVGTDDTAIEDWDELTQKVEWGNEIEGEGEGGAKGEGEYSWDQSIQKVDYEEEERIDDWWPIEDHYNWSPVVNERISTQSGMAK